MALITDDVHYQPNLPVFSARRSTNGWTVISNNGNKNNLILNTTDINIGGHYNTSNYTFTAPRPGVYHFSATVYARFAGDYLDTDSDYYNLYIDKNGASPPGTYYIAGYYNDGDYDMSSGFNATLELASNDYVQLRISTAATSGAEYYGALCRFSGFFLG